ncbi:MAG: hypothetical protein WAL71_17135 [Terriglobales bacterium]|jgi:hypothetical protein
MTDAAERSLKVVLTLAWAHDDVYHAKVSVTVIDSCYVPGNLHVGLPAGKAGIPEMEYLSFDFTHKGGICSDIVKTIDKTIDVRFSSAKPKVTAFAIVNGTVVGQDTKPFPKRG